MAKKLNFVISADNNPAIKALSEMSVALNKVGAAFKAINASQKAAAKTGGGILDNKALNSAGEALKEVSDGFKSLTVNAQQYNKKSGFDDLEQGFKKNSRAAKDFRTSITDLLGPLTVLTGVGSIAGVAAIAEKFGKDARENQKTSYLTGSSTASIQSMVNKGRMYGISPDDMRSNYLGVSSKIEDAVQGRDPQFLSFLQRQEFGIGDISKAYNAPNGIENIIDKVLGSLQRNYKNPRERAALLQNTPFSGYIPELMYSDKETDRRNRMAQDLGPMGDIDKLNSLEGSLNGVAEAFDKVYQNMTVLGSAWVPQIDKISGYVKTADGLKNVTDQLSIAIGITLVGALALLTRAIYASPIGRLLVIADAAVNIGKAIGGTKTFQDDVYKPAVSFWDRFHPGNFGTNKSMIESQADYDKRMSFVSGQPETSTGINQSSGISVSGNAPPVVYNNITVTAPPGTKVTSTSSSPHSKNHINYTSSGLAFQQ